MYRIAGIIALVGMGLLATGCPDTARRSNVPPADTGRGTDTGADASRRAPGSETGTTGTGTSGTDRTGTDTGTGTSGTGAGSGTSGSGSGTGSGGSGTGSGTPR